MKKIEKLITEIMNKYNIGKRPLSIILGYGEITLTRYIDGTNIPDDETITFLDSIKNNPEEYMGYLAKNENNPNISRIAFNKSLKAVKSIIDKKTDDKKINTITNYIIERMDSITNLKLQKILYYCQLFSYVINGHALFNSNTEAWKHGPVYKNIYFKYKSFGDKEISTLETKNDDVLDIDESRLIDKVIESFGVYAGNVLCYFTHSEKPWKTTYDDDNCNIIAKDLIESFANEIKARYDIKTVDDIDKYTYQCLSNYKKRGEKND